MLHAQLYFNFDNADRQLRIYIAVVNIALILFLSCLFLQLAAQVRATMTLHLGIKSLSLDNKSDNEEDS